MQRDYVIVGGGVYGTCVAWELARRGADVLLLEAGTIASGASGGPGKRGVRANGRDVRELPLMHMAYDLWPALADEIGAATGYERTGHLQLIERMPNSPADTLRSAPARQWLQQQHGIPTELLDRDGVLSMEPQVSENIAAALYCPNDGVADHTATTHGLAQAAMRAGADVREQTRVTGLERDGSRVSAVLTEQGERIGVNRSVLLLANTSVPAFVAQQLGVTLPVWSCFYQVLVTEPVEPMPLRHLIGHDSRTLAMKAIPGDGVMITGGWLGRWNAELGHAETIPEQVQGDLAEAVAVYPVLRDIKVATADVSRQESVSVDEVPIIDALPGVENMLIGCGWSGHGFAISPAIAKLLAAWALDGERPELLRPFCYSRFLPQPAL